MTREMPSLCILEIRVLFTELQGQVFPVRRTQRYIRRNEDVKIQRGSVGEVEFKDAVGMLLLRSCSLAGLPMMKVLGGMNTMFVGGPCNSAR